MHTIISEFTVFSYDWIAVLTTQRQCSFIMGFHKSWVKHLVFFSMCFVHFKIENISSKIKSIEIVQKKKVLWSSPKNNPATKCLVLTTRITQKKEENSKFFYWYKTKRESVMSHSKLHYIKVETANTVKFCYFYL